VQEAEGERLTAILTGVKSSTEVGRKISPSFHITQDSGGSRRAEPSPMDPVFSGSRDFLIRFPWVA
jgi:hypothetical protein